MEFQRLAELLTRPLRHYSRWDKFFRAVEKTLSVVTTVDGAGLKEARRGAYSGSSTETVRLHSHDSTLDLKSPALSVTLASSASNDTLILQTLNSTSTPDSDEPRPKGDPLQSAKNQPSTNAHGDDKEDPADALDLPSFDNDRPKTPEPPHQILPFLQDSGPPDTTAHTTSDTSTSPRPNVLITHQPVPGQPAERAEASSVQPARQVEVTVEVEDCGEVSAPAKETEEPPSL